LLCHINCFTEPRPKGAVDSSLLAQSGKRIETRGAPCRPQARRRCNSHQHYHRQGERRWIARRNLKQNTRYQSRKRCRSRESNHHAYHHWPQSVGENGRDNVRRVGAERHSNADLLGALNRRVRHHSIDSHRREGKRRRREESEKHCLETRLANTLFDALIHGGDAIHRLIRIEPSNHG
jgi:hypothetical protein